MAVCKQCGAKFSTFGAYSISGICNDCFFAAERKKAEQQHVTPEEAPTQAWRVLTIIGFIFLGLFGLFCLVLAIFFAQCALPK